MAHLQEEYTGKLSYLRGAPISLPPAHWAWHVCICMFSRVAHRHGTSSYMDFSLSIVGELVDVNISSSHRCTIAKISDDTLSEGIADGMHDLEAAGSCSTSVCSGRRSQNYYLPPLSRYVQPSFPCRLVTPDELCCLARSSGMHPNPPFVIRLVMMELEGQSPALCSRQSRNGDGFYHERL